MHPLTQFSKKNPMLSIMIVALVARLWFLLVSDHVYYPDEIFQTLEPAFERITGFGIQAWEYEAGIRPLFLPELLSMPLRLLLSLARGDTQVYTLLTKILLACWSTTIPLAVYAVIKKTSANTDRARRWALLTGLVAALWFELLYIAPRALNEALALNFLASTYLILDKARSFKAYSSKKELLYATVGCLLVLAVATRPHLLVLTPFALHWLYSTKRWERNRILFGSLITLFALGTHEYAHTGYFMHSYLRYIELQLTTPISNVFGTQPLLYYFKALVATSGVLLLPSLITLGNAKSRIWWFILIVFVASHSLIDHKELRFMLPIMPVVLVLFGQSLELWHRNISKAFKRVPELVVAIATGFSILSLFYLLPWIKTYYAVPLLAKDPLMKTARVLHRDASVCGVYVENRSWPVALSHYLINRNVPLYSQDYPPPNLDVISHKLTQEDATIAVMIKQPATCKKDPNYTNKRTFPEIQAIIEGR
jgi:hypothetical protein